MTTTTNGLDLTLREMLEYLKTTTNLPHEGEGTMIESLETACDYYDTHMQIARMIELGKQRCE